jgi:hypothetical protein
MKHKPRFTLALLSAFAALSTAQAQTTSPDAHSKMYAEIGYTSLSFENKHDDFKWKASPSMVTGVFGYQPHPNIAIEGLLGFGAGKGKLKYNGEKTGDDIKLGNMYGVFVRPSATIGDSFEVFGRLGWAHTEAKASDGGRFSEGNVAYGLGARYHVNKSSYLQANWTSFYKKRDLKVEGMTLAYGMSF